MQRHEHVVQRAHHLQVAIIADAWAFAVLAVFARVELPSSRSPKLWNPCQDSKSQGCRCHRKETVKTQGLRCPNGGQLLNALRRRLASSVLDPGPGEPQMAHEVRG